MTPLTPRQQKLAEDARLFVFFMAKDLLNHNEQFDDDFISDATFAVIRAAKGYEEGRAAWSTYACTAIKNAFLETRRKKNSRDAAIDGYAESLKVREDPITEETDEIRRREKAAAATLVKKIRSRVSVEAYEILREKAVLGKTFSEIGAKRGVTAQRAWQILQDARRESRVALDKIRRAA